MLSVPEAQAIVLQHAQPLPPASVALESVPLGAVLAEDVASDLDMPPFDKAMMDGYAIRSADLASGTATLTVVEEVTAGQTPRQPVGPGQATRIMTGAPIPGGVDAVVMIERTTLDQDRVTIEDKPPKPGQHILPRGREIRTGEIILKSGCCLRPQEFGLLAAVGKTSVRVQPLPRVAVLPTGDEIVDPGVKPGPGQIRNSNGPMLAAQVHRAGGVPRLLGIARDTVDSLRSFIQKGLQADVLILSGGVSAGKLDLVPGVLEELGVKARFHKVLMKPGKPVFFGSRGSTLVFGLPGNPVSSLVCFELFVRPALRRLQNHAEPLPPLWRIPLGRDFAYKTDRPTYHPACVQWLEGQCQLTLFPWFGSPDLRGLTGANALAVIAPGEHQFRSGQMLDVLPLESF
jgi:molybdopterin molybdotransferase